MLQFGDIALSFADKSGFRRQSVKCCLIICVAYILLMDQSKVVYNLVPYNGLVITHSIYYKIKVKYSIMAVLLRQTLLHRFVPDEL